MGIASFFIFVLIASAFIPQYVFIFLALNLLAGLFLSISQIIIALIPHRKPKQYEIKSQPFVSVLIPAYNEPPAILMQTIESMSKLEYNQFEVLVIDNNTQDQTTWKPVKAFMETLGDRFKFFHVDKLPGFKAGALNYILKKIDKRSEFIAIIDADYLVDSKFLATAISFFSEKIALVQFPQHYRNCILKNQPITDEYRHFFEIYMNMANHLDCVPSTGTVSMYRLNVLNKIGGFRGEALTEDADVGLRIYEAGYRGVYVDFPVGHGLMPYDIESYRKQKWRWAFGNAQSLKTLLMLFGKISFRSWIGFLSHLTAWQQFLFLPFAALAAFPVILHPAIHVTQYHKQVLICASLAIFITLASKALLFLVTFRKKEKFIVRALRAFVVHMGMSLVYSEAWIAFVFGKKFGFERTNKFVLKKMPSIIKNTYIEIILGFWYLLGAVAAIWWGNLIMVVAFLVAALVVFSVFYVYWKIKPTKVYSEKLLLSAEKKYQQYLL